MTYINKRGDPVRVAITNHARDRFLERWHRAFPGRPLPADLDTAIGSWFGKARRLHPKRGQYRARMRRYGEDTLYFFAPPFIFVVQSSVLRTVELGSRGTRELNRDGGRAVAREPEAPTRPPERFRIVGWMVRDNGARNKSVKLGSIDAFRFAGRPERLRGDERFLQLARERFEAKCPGRELIGIWVRPTGKGPSVWIWGDQAPAARRWEMREAS